jgi:hypothetical protein
MKISTRKYILDPRNLRKAILKSYRAKTARQRAKKEVVNFADNVLIFAADKETATMAGKIARSFAATRLRLHFHKGDHVAPVTSEGIHFCGRTYYPNGKVFLRKGTKENIAKRKNRPLSVASYQGILRSANCKHLTKTIWQNKEHPLQGDK